MPRSPPATDCYQNLHIDNYTDVIACAKFGDNWFKSFFFIDGCPKIPVSYRSGGDHYNSLHYRAAVI